MRKILLMGNPNVGKSVVFTRLTGVNVIASNYPGTTVEFTRGYMKLKEEKVEIIDVPGTYTLEPTSKAEEVAVDMLKEGDVVVNIIDSTNLERNLNLTFQLFKKNIPMVVVLNFWDETKHKGININAQKLEEILEVPVIPTTALTGEGINVLVQRLPQAKTGSYQYEDKEKWHEIGKIVEQVQTLKHRHHLFSEALADVCVRPVSGVPIAIGILYLSFTVIRFIGEWIIGYVTQPMFENLWAPLMMKLSPLLGSGGFLHDILIGQLIEGELDFMQSFGLLTTGLFVPIAAVLPYIFSFYLILGILEDTGYLPRMAVLVDRVMHIVGLHGMGFIPMLLGLGCNVPGALACRVMETRKEKFIGATLMAIAVPCMAQIAMIVGLIGKYGARGLFPVFATLVVVWVIAGFLMRRYVKGESPEMFAEIPPYRFPYFAAVGKKLWMRVVRFLMEALPFVLLGVFIVNILYSLGIIDFLGRAASPIITKLFGLPLEAIGALIIGFLRKDVAVGMLAPLGLSLKQLIIASTVLCIYFPCVATFAVMVRELGIKDMLKSVAIMIGLALLVGGILNLIL
ncbi:ferrous iron transporter B [Candidatus Desantisbacteria bacterium CG1_02_38_46]|uniref:Ferrous iron transporter B n=3 Tax=unclassified Candidatus Desantisiibacteriota TaxID=3106372 RepID=A0A2H9PBT8_9BACT|nr:MAG: ferrous iron transporter B [Candidatus Desantisbacteria bacterium CG1_02_38_46]PIU51435.1 MAG: ferrous iron transporter B [Candidatus Desantisbacteria bacterium CG07_land_8_20_14_0_80_39_15]PIZ15469.1 MAG: ferrous iron transporter B [Candidatus Desantisbacteria bacterium CG_4_10_14_0_8_um_filter_39_17]